MKFLLTFYLALLFCSSLFGQIDSSSFDFWVGDWEVSWYDSDSSLIVGYNQVSKILDDRVIQENFVDPSTNMKGTSISVYNRSTNQWHQAWADNQGGYYNFIGIVEGDKRIFQTPNVNSQGFIFRMRFDNISANSLEWFWEGKKLEAEEWTLLWKIDYKRKK